MLWDVFRQLEEDKEKEDKKEGEYMLLDGFSACGWAEKAGRTFLLIRGKKIGGNAAEILRRLRWLTGECTVLPYVFRCTGYPSAVNGRKVLYREELEMLAGKDCFAGASQIIVPYGKMR